MEEGQDYEVIVDFMPADDFDLQKFYNQLEVMGTSIQVGEGEGMYRMHIHVPLEKRYEPIDYVMGLGTITKVGMENLMAQMEDVQKSKASRVAFAPVQPGQIAVVVVSPGAGLSRIFASLGAAATVEGGQTKNPSTQDILNSFENLPTDKIIILPNNKNIVMAANQAMQQQNRVLETLSITDSLTGLYNRSKLDAILSDQLARFRRTQRAFTLLMMDIDHFKTLNDTYGHLTGDEVLAAVAQILAQSIRSIDYAARYGGDEFIIILVETSAEQALKTAERICDQVEGMVYNIDGSSIAVTVSIGIVQCQPEDQTPTAVFARADRALYEAKHAGRNRAHCAV